MRISILAFLLPVLTAVALSSCLGNDDVSAHDYAEWREQNTQYITDLEYGSEGAGFEKIIPDWDNSVFALVKWHTRGSGEQSGIYPLSTSVLQIKYVLKNISGRTMDSSASFKCQPCNLITGFWATLTHMNVGDSVTAVLPYFAAYGETGSAAVLPYSTLIFNIKLDSIIGYETLPWR